MPHRFEAQVRALAKNFAQELVELELRHALANLGAAIDRPSGAKVRRPRRAKRPAATKGVEEPPPKAASARPPTAPTFTGADLRAKPRERPAVTNAALPLPVPAHWSKPRVAAILKRAARVIHDAGVDALSRDVCAAIGEQKTNIYHYFGDWRKFVLEALRFSYIEYLGEIREGTRTSTQSSSASVLESMGEQWRRGDVRHLCFKLGVWGYMLTNDDVRRQAASLREEHHAALAEQVALLMGPYVAAAHTRALSTLIIAAATGLSAGAMLEDDDGLANEAHDLFLALLGRGLEALAGRTPGGERLRSRKSPELNGDDARSAVPQR